MIGVPAMGKFANSIEAGIVNQPFVQVRNVDLRRSDKTGLTNQLRNEYGVRSASVSIGLISRSVTVHYSSAEDGVSTDEKIREAVRDYAYSNDYTSGSTMKFSAKRFVRALKR